MNRSQEKFVTDIQMDRQMGAKMHKQAWIHRTFPVVVPKIYLKLSIKRE